MATENLQGIVIDVIDDLIEKRKECDEIGEHKKVVWSKYTISSNSSYRDEVDGICRYCLTNITRPLNQSELKRLSSFREHFYDSFRPEFV